MLGDAWSAHSPHPRVERLADLVMACALIVLTLPLVMAVAIAIKCDSRGPVIMWKKRNSPSGREFWALRFRSTAHGPGITFANRPEATFVGSVIRTFRIDLLPQLVNVLRGEMTCHFADPERLFFLK
jgi:lipopolysaccharide/colanic/teichoic acid biosynthesis glycosyltransferase